GPLVVQHVLQPHWVVSDLMLQQHQFVQLVLVL
ncbi:hypothetical protein A2U01_0105378, partial [Trifolium medium]|nr:hypothetical protein [Trifolium medium]